MSSLYPAPTILASADVALLRQHAQGVHYHLMGEDALKTNSLGPTATSSSITVPTHMPSPIMMVSLCKIPDYGHDYP